jgi:hypothetical protein
MVAPIVVSAPLSDPFGVMGTDAAFDAVNGIGPDAGAQFGYERWGS